MPMRWMDVSSLSFKTLLLLERVQLSWFPGWAPERELAIALTANPCVEWYLRHKCPELAPWLDHVMAQPVAARGRAVRDAEIAVLRAMEDLVVYAVDPAVYDAQPFLGWDSAELTALADFAGQTVIDVGAGTGRLSLVAAERGATVFAVEPVANLRHYLRRKALDRGLPGVYPVDGLITDIPFPDGFAGIVMAGHVFGDALERENAELHRVARPGGLIILCPGSSESETATHEFLVAAGYAWSRFEEPRDGWKRKYWKTR